MVRANVTAKPATYRRYVTSSKALLQHFKDVSLDKFTPDEVERYKIVRQAERRTARGKCGRKTAKGKIKPATVNRELACLRAMFNHVLKSDVPLKNPIGKMGAKTLREDNEQMRVLGYDEQAKYLAAATLMLRDVATLMLETGMRPEEVYRMLTGERSSGQDQLVQPIRQDQGGEEAHQANGDRQACAGKANQRVQGRSWSAGSATPPTPTSLSQESTSPRPSACGTARWHHFRLYDLRHTWATRAAMSGIDLVTLAAMLGHSKINMGLRYAHPTQEHQTQAMERLERFVAEQQIEAEARRQGIDEMAVQ